MRIAKSILLLAAFAALLWATVGCAATRAAIEYYLGTPDPDTGNKGGMKFVGDAARMFSFLGNWAPPPFNVILEGAGWLGTAVAGKAAHSSVKNSEPGRVLGPVRKKKQAPEETTSAAA